MSRISIIAVIFLAATASGCTSTAPQEVDAGQSSSEDASLEEVSADYAVVIDLRRPGQWPEGDRVLSWADDDGGATYADADDTERSMRLIRTFSSEAEARAFRGEYVLVIGDRERDRDQVTFGDCDFMDEMGLSFGDKRVVFLSREYRSGEIREIGSPHCGAEIDPPRYRLDRHDVEIEFTAPRSPTDFYGDGAEFQLESVRFAGTNKYRYRFTLSWPLNTNLDEAQATLHIDVEDYASGSVEIRFDQCDHEYRSSDDDVGVLMRVMTYLIFGFPEEYETDFVDEDFDPEDADRELMIDPWGGMDCFYDNGMGYGATP